MSNKSTIKCPNCQHEFEATDAFRDEVQRDLNEKAKKWQLQKEEEFKKKEDAFRNELNESLVKQKLSIEESVKKSVANDYENKLKLLSDANIQNEAKLKAAREKELEFLKKEQELKTKEAELEISLQKKLNAERAAITETIRKQEIEKVTLRENEFLLKQKELEKQLDDQKKLVDEMKRKAEQGLTQRQGEMLELEIESWLKTQFPLDTIEEIKKGARGADCLQIVNTREKQNCGTIYYESKRTKDFSLGWIEKFKTDMREKGATIGILVTEAFPKDMERMGQKEGIWICSFEEFKGLCFVLRETVITMDNLASSQENKGEKMAMLYNFLTGTEFKMQVEAIVEGFTSMQSDLDSERRAMEGIWKKREKQIQKVLLNTTHMYQAVRGIAGNAIGPIKSLELGE